MIQACPRCHHPRHDNGPECVICRHLWDAYDSDATLIYPTTPTTPEFWTREVTHEAALLLPLIPDDRAFVGAEIGTHIAKTATILLHHRPHLSLYLIDTWERSPERFDMACDNLHSADVHHRATIVRGESSVAAGLMSDLAVDFAFIDASKEPGSYRADCLAWLPKVRPGGFLAGHDWNVPTVPPIATEIAKMAGAELHVDTASNGWWFRV